MKEATFESKKICSLIEFAFGQVINQSLAPRLSAYWVTFQIRLSTTLPGKMEIFMSYIQQVIQPGEKLRHIASIHWIVYLPGMVLAAIALVVFGYSELATNGKTIATIAAALLGIAALYYIGREWFAWWTTEIAVTNHRIIFKTGLI